MLTSRSFFAQMSKVMKRQECCIYDDLLLLNLCHSLFSEGEDCVKASMETLRNRVEKLSPKESPEDAHTVLRGADPKDSVSIRGTTRGDSFSSQLWGFYTVGQTFTILRPS